MAGARSFGMKIKTEELVAIDLASRDDSDYFKRYIRSKSLEVSVKTYWNTNQADCPRLLEIVKQEFDSPIDLVIDGGSHLYAQTKSTIETLFPVTWQGGCISLRIGRGRIGRSFNRRLIDGPKKDP